MRKCPKFIVVCCGLMYCINVYAYERNNAVKYADDWTHPINMQPANIVVYYKYTGADCANFVSQCVIAGGMRFRSSLSALNNVDVSPLPIGFPEIETGVGTRHIQDDNMETYSRTVPVAANLLSTLCSSRHGGRLYTPGTLQDGSPVWADVRPGDVVFKSTGHAMLITGVVVGGAANDVLFCAHTTWRNHQSLNALVPDSDGSGIADWKEAIFQIVCLPDAPLIELFHIWTGNAPLLYRWANTGWFGPASGRFFAGLEDLKISIAFDTPMDTTSPAKVVLIGIDWDLSFLPIETLDPTQGGTHWNGWQTSGGAPDTWDGIIPMEALPLKATEICTVSILARSSDDSSANDADNNLDRYDPGPMELLQINLDTRSPWTGFRVGAAE